MSESRLLRLNTRGVDMSSIYKDINISKDTRECEVYEAWCRSNDESEIFMVRVEVPTYAPSGLIYDLLTDIALSIPFRK